MIRTLHIAAGLMVMLALGSPAAAQTAYTPAAAPANPDEATKPDAEAEAAAKAEAEKQSLKDAWKKGRPISMQYFRAVDQRGINVFETTKTPGVEYTGFKLDINAAFTAQVQNLSHSNTAVPVMALVVEKIAKTVSGVMAPPRSSRRTPAAPL